MMEENLQKINQQEPDVVNKKAVEIEKDFKKNTIPAGMSLSLKWGKIRVYHDTIVALNEPKHI